VALRGHQYTDRGMSVSLLVAGAGDALDVSESLLQGLLARRSQAGLAEHRSQAPFAERFVLKGGMLLAPRPA
jgi:hypothetical protein